MVAIRSQDADRFLRQPDPAVRIILLYGSDDGLIAERAAGFAKAVLGDAQDDFGLLRLDSAEIAAEPGRLADEANAIPLFGGPRAIRVRISGSRSIQAAVEALLRAPPRDNWVILEAGEIRRGTGLRKLCESAPGAAAIGCYSDDAAALDRLIAGELTAFRVDDDAKRLLRSLLGSDRLASRGELAKLALYARGREAITVADIQAVIGDGGAFASDEVADAAAAGDVSALDRQYRRMLAAGQQPFTVASASLRHFQLLHRIRAAIDAGEPVAAAIDRSGAAIFFPRRARLEDALRHWSADRLLAATERLERAIFESRVKGALDEVVIGQALLSVAAAARPRRAA